MTQQTDMRHAFFVSDGDRFVATEHTRGPWSVEHQHGGPSSALLARAVERAVADDPAFQIARLSVELMAPVPGHEQRSSSRPQGSPYRGDAQLRRTAARPRDRARCAR
jgi:hypothetical protein